MDTMIKGLGSLNLGQVAKQKENDNETDFSDLLKSAIGEVDQMQKQSADMKTKLITGELQDIHQVTIAAEKANISFQLTMQVRNKIVEAYQEIMRMQV